ncbi:MAG: nuclear transport factor 2 family protein [Sphingobacteriaceae bacterium]
MFRITTVIILVYLFSLNKSFAQQNDTSSLYNEIIRVDSLLFNAFNTCDTILYKEYFTDDLEFYHDREGLTVSLKNELQSFTGNCATGLKLRRELVKRDLEIYPIKNYGAIQIGTHRFYHTKKGETEKFNGTYKFIHVWRKETNGQWKLSRIISYGHEG